MSVSNLKSNISTTIFDDNRFINNLDDIWTFNQNKFLIKDQENVAINQKNLEIKSKPTNIL